jgi:hypothetical protein
MSSLTDWRHAAILEADLSSSIWLDWGDLERSRLWALIAEGEFITFIPEGDGMV